MRSKAPPSFWTFISIVFGLWLFSPIVFHLTGLSLDERGVVGDSYGAVNALFSGLAFAGVLYSLFLQRAELEGQKEELLEARRQSAKQIEILAAQVQTMQAALEFEKHRFTSESQPALVWNFHNIDADKCIYQVTNKGGRMKVIDAEGAGTVKRGLLEPKIIGTGERANVSIFPTMGGFGDVCILHIHYEDGLGNRKTQSFRFNIKTHVVEEFQP